MILMYQYLLSGVIIVLTFLLFFWKKASQRMEHVVGRLATKFLENMLEQVRQKIITGGYEHWTLDIIQKDFTLPDLFSCNITIKNLLCTGASRFVTNNVSYDVTTSRAIFDISIPKLFLAIGDATARTTISAFGMDFDAQVKGWVTLMEPRVIGAVVLEINDEGKVTATSVDLNIELKEIQSKVNLNAMEADYSEAVNNFLREKLPTLINTYVNKCKGAMEVGLMSIANPILAQMF